LAAILPFGLSCTPLKPEIHFMEYSKIVAVSGLPGLFELISSKSDGAIVRSLDDKSTRFVANRVHNFSHLESIEIYTVRDNVNLVEIFQAMEKSGEKLPDEKDAAAVRKYFEKVFPDMDFDRVYPSDMKKMVKWFDVLSKNKIELKLSEPEEEPSEEPAAETETEPVTAEAPSAKSRKAPAKKAADKAAPEEKEPKKAPAKKKSGK
jgi:hypothetical protein